MVLGKAWVAETGPRLVMTWVVLDKGLAAQLDLRLGSTWDLRMER